MAELPEDVIEDHILICLPVKSLLRFRCVSKRFLALIDGPHFINRHLNRSLLTKFNHKLILRGRARNAPASTSRLYSMDLDKLDQALQLDQPSGAEFLGSVNGLVCLLNTDNEVIWNFATRNYHKLPSSGIHLSALHAMVYSYGFGYDSVSDDYKLLKLVQFYESGFTFKSETKLYSLRSNSWQRIQNFPYYILYLSHGQQVCGALHWVMSPTRGSDATNLIVAFDLATNEYKVVDHPEVLEMPYHVQELEGRLCVPYISPDRADLWVMKDYGVKELWSKLYSISQPELISSSNFVLPLAYLRSGTETLLLHNNVKLLWYSLKEGVKRISTSGCPEDFLPEVCVESLVPLSGNAKDSKGPKEELIGGVKKRNDFLSQGFKLKL